MRGLKHRCMEIVVLLKYSGDSIYYKEFKDGAFVFEVVSEKKASNSGVTWEKMIGKTDFDFMPEEEAQRAYEDDLLVFQTGAVIDREEELTRLDGTKSWVSTNKFPWPDADGNIIGVVGISRDITQKKEAEESLVQSMIEKEKAIIEKEKAIAELEKALEKLEKYAAELLEANRDRTRMVSIVTHDIRSPLVSIISTIKLLLRGSFGPIDESVRKTLLDLLGRTQRLEKTANDYLSVSSIMHADIGQKEMLDIREDIIDPILEEYSGEIEAKKIIVDMALGAIPGNRLLVKASKDLKIVYRNVIDNTIKHTPIGGTMAFGFEEQADNKIKLNIYGSGAPVPPEMTEKIFEMFESNTGSTGIGLSISRELVRKHGGDMWYENSWDGHPNFVFTIPKD